MLSQQPTPTRFGRITNYGSTVPCLFKAESSNRDCSVAQPYESILGWLSNDKYQHSKDHLTAKINVEHRVQRSIYSNFSKLNFTVISLVTTN